MGLAQFSCLCSHSLGGGEGSSEKMILEPEVRVEIKAQEVGEGRKGASAPQVEETVHIRGTERVSGRLRYTVSETGV